MTRLSQIAARFTEQVIQDPINLWGTKMHRSDSVLAEVKAHRNEQISRYGFNDDLEDGTGPGRLWATPVSFRPAVDIEALFRYEYGTHTPTWMHLVREEVAEAFMATNLKELRAELIQVAALCVSWIESLDVR